MTPFEAAEKGFRARVLDNAQLLNLIGSPGRVTPGWPAETMTAEDFPRLTYFIVDGGIKRPGVVWVRLQADEWVWPDGDQGGRNRLLSIDALLEAVIDEQHWTHGDHRLYALCVTVRDHPSGPGFPLRRRRDIEVRASPDVGE